MCSRPLAVPATSTRKASGLCKVAVLVVTHSHVLILNHPLTALSCDFFAARQGSKARWLTVRIHSQPTQAQSWHQHIHMDAAFTSFLLEALQETGYTLEGQRQGEVISGGC